MSKELAAALRELADSPEAKERARKLVEDELVAWRDSGMFLLRRNGLAIRNKDGSGSEIIRFGFEMGWAMALKAEADRIEAAQ